MFYIATSAECRMSVCSCCRKHTINVSCYCDEQWNYQNDRCSRSHNLQTRWQINWSSPVLLLNSAFHVVSKMWCPVTVNQMHVVTTCGSVLLWECEVLWNRPLQIMSVCVVYDQCCDVCYFDSLIPEPTWCQYNTTQCHCLQWNSLLVAKPQLETDAARSWSVAATLKNRSVFEPSRFSASRH